MARLIRIDASAVGSRRLLRKRLPPYGCRASRGVPWALQAYDDGITIIVRDNHGAVSFRLKRTAFY
jgi:hypothetical protein